jgi:hypothetical protein
MSLLEEDREPELSDSQIDQKSDSLCLKNTQGIIIVSTVYLLMSYEYFMTLYFGIWQ